MICNNCGRKISLTFVAMWDYCPECKASPVIDASRSQTLPGFETLGVYEEELDIPTVETYSVPIDPASLNDCEACQ